MTDATKNMTEEQKEKYIHKLQCSIAVLMFGIIGIFLISFGILSHEIITIVGTVIFLLVGLGLCIAGIVYSDLSKRKYELTGLGLTGVMLSRVGTAISAILVTILSVCYLL